MAVARRALAVVLVAGLAGCSAPSGPPPRSSTATAGPSPSVAPSSAPGATPGSTALPSHQVVAGPDVGGAFDLATDGSVIAWSDGTVDVDAPALWALDVATGETRLAYRSGVRGAILANLALRRGTFAFAEVTPRADGSRTWRLVLLDSAGGRHVLDANDVPVSQEGTLPMAALSDRGILWATSHAGDADSLRCELRYAPFEGLRPRTVVSEPCSRAELWYPRSDGARFVYGSVEYGADGRGVDGGGSDAGAGAADQRHVYLVDDADLVQPRRLDSDGQASLPAILDDTVVWKLAPRDLNMFSPAGIAELSLAVGSAPRDIPLPPDGPRLLTTPSIGLDFIVADDLGGGAVVAWDRRRELAVEVDRLSAADPGFLSGARLAGRLLAWFHTSSAGGGGTREIRWLLLPSS
jgi:hypothetical protein